MITKKRLEELIKQGATIYEVKYNNINPVSLKNKIRFIHEKYNVIAFEPRPNEKYKHHKYFDKLFETLEEAEWHKEFGCIERTVKLDLPKWEDIEKDKKFHYIRHFVLSKKFSFFIEIYKFTNTIGVSWSGGCKKTDPRFDRIWELTKENYFEACRKAKELFLGE